eukprot:CAMPEP_0196999948 /NCGR_PEP_ID=MMETSP1380-20130617/5023_1 /TAXON_ID=5936 /ORGANISM="Euplotes crassus, Strain CT5" /LENGTH=102 /DNA_ID=CAMNT_0042417079 /DNA_START=526 /DNA_END=834 /DNA_ORIENTATION=-
MKEGLGYIILPEGSLIQGEFYRGEPVYGRFIQLTGDVYEGQLEDYSPNGKGKVTRDGEVIFKGSFIGGVYHEQTSPEKATSKKRKSKKYVSKSQLGVEKEIK